jgi:hypothetical protein
LSDYYKTITIQVNQNDKSRYLSEITDRPAAGKRIAVVVESFMETERIAAREKENVYLRGFAVS